jgi:hypothetical protein
MIGNSDVIQSLIFRLRNASGSWSTRVYPQGATAPSGAAYPLLMVGVLDSDQTPIEVPDDERMTVYQVSVFCITDTIDNTLNFWAPEELAKEVMTELAASELPLYAYSGSTKGALIDTRYIRNLETSSRPVADVADQFGKDSREITGFLNVFHAKT